MDYTRSGVSRSVSGWGQWDRVRGNTRDVADCVVQGDEAVANRPMAVTRCASPASRDGAVVAAST